MNNKINWFNRNEIKSLRERHESHIRNLLGKKIAAREKGDTEAQAKATRELVKQMRKTKVYEQKAEEAGNCWY